MFPALIKNKDHESYGSAAKIEQLINSGQFITPFKHLLHGYFEFRLDGPRCVEFHRFGREIIRMKP